MFTYVMEVGKQGGVLGVEIIVSPVKIPNWPHAHHI